MRIPYGGHIGAVEHHQESPEAYFAHTPGLRVVSPATPHDAYWMIQEAVSGNDPVIFLEPKSRYWPKGDVDLDVRGAGLHASRIVRAGTDVTLIAHGAMVSTLLDAAELAAGEGTSVEVVDLRSLSPVDYGPILDSVRRTAARSSSRRRRSTSPSARRSPRRSPSARSTRSRRPSSG